MLYPHVILTITLHSWQILYFSKQMLVDERKECHKKQATPSRAKMSKIIIDID